VINAALAEQPVEFEEDGSVTRMEADGTVTVVKPLEQEVSTPATLSTHALLNFDLDSARSRERRAPRLSA
jgi:type IV secretory pathway VirB9-like protein